jgi:predicted transcriptional regulator
LNDDQRSGRPENKNRDELLQKIREIIAVDGNFTVRMLAEELGTNRETVRHILTKDLGKKKVCARFVPHELNEDECTSS